jgi:hypothetical protein
VDLEILPLLSKFNICKALLPVLQNEVCALWNQIVLEARHEWHPHVDVLRSIRHLYVALHQGTEAAPTLFSAYTQYHASMLSLPSRYSLYNVRIITQTLPQFIPPITSMIPVFAFTHSSHLGDPLISGDSTSREPIQIVALIANVHPNDVTPDIHINKI